jgi:16S rRNA A1518/A1519 N6-dimethyltransferase RsmA/KsgA/DIM1 with predicted DNA glycosylase/AP lyase activity
LSIGWEKSFELIKILNITHGDVCWEIGCGIPKLAFALSAVTGAEVVATELRKFLSIYLF